MRQGKKIVVWAMAVLMIANSAWAGRWRHWGQCQPVYCQADYCAPAYSSGCYESSCGTSSACGDCGVVYESGCGSSTAADCSGCDGVTTDKIPAKSIEITPSEPATPQPSLDSDVPPAPPEPAPVNPTPAPSTPRRQAPPAATFTPPATQPSVPPAAAPTPAPTTTTPVPTTPAPTTTTPAPTTTPTAPSAEVEDLFSQPESTPAQPQTKPAEPAEVEDLFKEPEAAPAKPAAGDEVDDLFKDLDEKPSGNKAAASEAPAATPAEPSKEVEDLFSEPANPMAAAEPKSESTDGMRLWTDNTGKYQVRARLVVVGRTEVRLLKDTGKFTTVPYSRLSQTDLAFVRTQTDASKVAGF